MVTIYSTQELTIICQQCLQLAKQAGQVIIEYYNKFTYEQDIIRKADNSPVTAADIASHKSIVQNLKNIKLNNKIISDYIISEESEPSEISTTNSHLDAKLYWLVDPLDGTKEFIDRTGEFCINIALMYENKPIIGVIYAPFIDIAYYGILNNGAYKLTTGLTIQKNLKRSNFSTKEKTKQRIINIVTSSRHLNNPRYNNLLQQLTTLGLKYKILTSGSALKFGFIAEGTADLYPRFGATSEWDTAAGDLIVHEAGGVVRDLKGKILSYNKPNNLINPEFFAANAKYKKFDWVQLFEKL